MIPLRDAVERLLALAVPLPPAVVPLRDAVGRAAAEDVRAPVTLPPLPNAGMDGYAVHSADIREASATRPVALRVVEAVEAAGMPTVAPGRYEATRVTTGAPLPAGVDTVVRVEDTDAGRAVVWVKDGRDAGRNVRPAGQDCMAGDVVLRAGEPVSAWNVGALAALGIAELAVRRAPRVAIVSSGDEIVPLERAAEGGRLRASGVVASNDVVVAAMARELGATVEPPAFAPDDPERLRAAIAEALGADVLVTSGGMSVGTSDHTKDAVRALGGTVEFWKVRCRPGSQIAVGRIGRTIWLGLPGNPVSAVVGGALFLRPLLRRLLGHRLAWPAAEHVSLAAPVARDARMTLLHRVSVDRPESGPLRARLAGAQASNLQTPLLRADALLVVPPGEGTVAAGETLRAVPFASGQWTATPTW